MYCRLLTVSCHFSKNPFQKRKPAAGVPPIAWGQREAIPFSDRVHRIGVLSFVLLPGSRLPIATAMPARWSINSDASAQQQLVSNAALAMLLRFRNKTPAAFGPRGASIPARHSPCRAKKTNSGQSARVVDFSKIDCQTPRGRFPPLRAKSGSARPFQGF